MSHTCFTLFSHNVFLYFKINCYRKSHPFFFSNKKILSQPAFFSHLIYGWSITLVIHLSFCRRIPPVNIRSMYALGITTLFPNLKDPDSKNGYASIDINIHPRCSASMHWIKRMTQPCSGSFLVLNQVMDYFFAMSTGAFLWSPEWFWLPGMEAEDCAAQLCSRNPGPAFRVALRLIAACIHLWGSCRVTNGMKLYQWWGTRVTQPSSKTKWRQHFSKDKRLFKTQPQLPLS